MFVKEQCCRFEANTIRRETTMRMLDNSCDMGGDQWSQRLQVGTPVESILLSCPDPVPDHESKTDKNQDKNNCRGWSVTHTHTQNTRMAKSPKKKVSPRQIRFDNKDFPGRYDNKKQTGRHHKNRAQAGIQMKNGTPEAKRRKLPLEKINPPAQAKCLAAGILGD